MAALAFNYEPAQQEGKLCGYNVKAATKIFSGALVSVEDASGLLIKSSDTAGQTFAGVAYESCDNSAGANGAAGLRVNKTGTYVYNFGSAYSLAVIGKKVYAVDDNTVALAATTANDIYVGDVVALVSGNKVRVRIDRAAG